VFCVVNPPTLDDAQEFFLRLYSIKMVVRPDNVVTYLKFSTDIYNTYFSIAQHVHGMTARRTTLTYFVVDVVYVYIYIYIHTQHQQRSLCRD
jgi:hypothetical protein